MYGKAIKSIRLSNGLSQSQLAKETGIPQNTISWIESDKGIANIFQIVKLADYYGISVDEFIDRDFSSDNYR